MSTLPHGYVSADEYLALERLSTIKHQYIDGEIIAMAGGSPAHSLIASNVLRALGNRLQGGPCLVFNSDLRVSVQRGNLITYPDVSVVCGPVLYIDDRRDTIANPRLIVEVLSPSTSDYDRGEKSHRYRTLPSIAEYLLIEPEPVEVEHYVRLPNGNWEIEAIRERDGIIHLGSVQCEFPVSEISRNLDRL